MTASLAELDAHEQPSDELRAEWKRISRLDPGDALQGGDHGPRIDDPRLAPAKSGFCASAPLAREQIARAFEHLDAGLGIHAQADASVLFHPLLPGLLIVPSLVPPAVQTSLLDKMLHRDLSDPRHQTNMHLHYHVPYPDAATVDSRSLFALAPDAAAVFRPRDPTVHKPVSPRQALERRIHWLTLGGQYDWTSREYPHGEAPAFPPDLAAFLGSLFPDTVAQAAIVNMYSPGDTMMMHRDVSEQTDRGLVSLSLGCDALFMIAPARTAAMPVPEHGADEQPHLVLRLRSGDAIYMTNESRYAWHGVPKVLKGTCPAHLQAWPARQDGTFSQWHGWMQKKRVNLNVRQMHE